MHVEVESFSRTAWENYVQQLQNHYVCVDWIAAQSQFADDFSSDSPLQRIWMHYETRLKQFWLSSSVVWSDLLGSTAVLLIGKLRWESLLRVLEWPLEQPALIRYLLGELSMHQAVNWPGFTLDKGESSICGNTVQQLSILGFSTILAEVKINISVEPKVFSSNIKLFWQHAKVPVLRWIWEKDVAKITHSPEWPLCICTRPLDGRKILKAFQTMTVNDCKLDESQTFLLPTYLPDMWEPFLDQNIIATRLSIFLGTRVSLYSW